MQNFDACLCLNLVTRVTLCGNVYDQCNDCGRVSSQLCIDNVCNLMIENLNSVKYIFNSRDIMYDYLNRYVHSVLYHVLKRVYPGIKMHRWKKVEIIEYIVNMVFEDRLIKSAIE